MFLPKMKILQVEKVLLTTLYRILFGYDVAKGQTIVIRVGLDDECPTWLIRLDDLEL